MKKIIGIFVLTFVFVLSSCQKDAGLGDVIYITGTESLPSISVSVEGPTNFGITVSATDKVVNDTHVQLEPSNAKLEAYNSKFKRSYKLLPAGSYDLNNQKVIIKSGSTRSTPLEVSIRSVESLEDGVTYCLPISIVNTDGEMPVLESSRTIYVVVSKVMVTKAVNLNGSTYFQVPTFQTAPEVGAMTAMTMECKVYVNKYNANNPFISSVIGIEENFLLRFGDVSCDKDQLQLAAGKINGKNNPMTTSTHFEVAKWYHLAIVYDGNMLTIYANGKEVASTSAGAGTINFNDTYMGGFHIGKSAQGRFLNGYVSEARIWNKAISGSQLVENMCVVDPLSEGLIAYWRFNGEAQNNVVYDLTGNGHNAIATGAIIWVDNVKCPF